MIEYRLKSDNNTTVKIPEEIDKVAKDIYGYLGKVEEHRDPLVLNILGLRGLGPKLWDTYDLIGNTGVGEDIVYLELVRGQADLRTEDGCEKFRENLSRIIKEITSKAVEEYKKAAEERGIEDIEVDLGINISE